jgi:hypothetical protein
MIRLGIEVDQSRINYLGGATVRPNTVPSCSGIDHRSKLTAIAGVRVLGCQPSRQAARSVYLNSPFLRTPIFVGRQHDPRRARPRELLDGSFQGHLPLRIKPCERMVRLRADRGHSDNDASVNSRFGCNCSLPAKFLDGSRRLAQAN